MLLRYVLLEVLVCAFDWGFNARTDKTSVSLLVFNLLLDVTKLCELIYDDSSNNICKQYIKKRPMYRIWKKPTIMTCLSFSRWRLPNYPLSIQWINTSNNGGTMRFYLSNIHVDWLVFIQNLNIVIYAQKSKDKGEGCC